MPAKHVVPRELRSGPFTLVEAQTVGITRRQLRGSSYCRMGSGLYRWTGLQESPLLMLAAVARRLPSGAAFSGRTAAWLHGLDLPPCDPIEVTIPEPFGSSRLAGASTRRAALTSAEIVMRHGMPSTAPLRTVVDLGSRDPLTEGVVAADAFAHARLVTTAELRSYIDEHPGARGIVRLRHVVDLAEPKTESPMETRLRMLLVLAGLPRPEVQVSIRDDGGRLVRPDLLYRRECVALEYDGFNHRDRLVDDNRRQNALVGTGLLILRFTASDVYGAPDTVVFRVRKALTGPPNERHTAIRAHSAASRPCIGPFGHTRPHPESA